MDLTIFLLAIAVMVVTIFWGYTRGVFAFAYLGMFVALLIGALLMQGGLDLKSGTSIVSVGADYVVTDTYTNHNSTNDPIINLVGGFLFIGGIVGILLTSLIVIKS